MATTASFQLPQEIRELTTKLMVGLDTPRSLTVYLLAKAGEWDQLVNLKVDPRTYLDNPFSANQLKRDYQATEFLRKCKDIKLKTDPEQAALEAWWAAEAQCKRTNDRLANYLELPVYDGPHGTAIADFIDRLQNIVASWLGPVPKHLDGAFGPGAVFESQGAKHSRNLTLGDKLQLQPSVTPAAKALFEHYFWPCAWGRAWMSDTNGSAINDSLRGNRFVSVDKDATIKRGIAIEGGGMVYLQLAVGGVIRRRLARIGIDLEKGQGLHQQLAMRASLTGNHATIDLKSASDTVCRNLVKLALRKSGDWYDLLESLRSPATRLNGKWVRLEKFSSMGNGFTFELETLIFAAVITAVGGGLIGHESYVYGDDIIVPSEHASNVISALRFLGFTTNERKTFTTSAFRESCGGDYFMGVDVRPYYMKEFPNEPNDWIAVANGLYRRWPLSYLRSDRVYRARFFSIGRLPSGIRSCRGPAELGDLVICSPEHQWNYVTRSSRRYFRVWRPIAKRIPLRRFSAGTQLAVMLYAVRNPSGILLFPKELHRVGLAIWADNTEELREHRSPVSTGLVPRRAIAGYRFGRVSYS